MVNVVSVPNRAALKALNSSLDKSAAIHDEGGRSGLFRFSGANLAASVSEDPQEGIYVAPASDTTGTAGAWVRVWNGAVDPRWWGAVGDNATNDYAALQACWNWVFNPSISGDFCTLDLGGRSYRTNSTITYSGNTFQRTVRSGVIRAGAAAASPILDFSGITHPDKMTRITFENVNVNSWGVGSSCVLLDETQHVQFKNCEIQIGATGYGIKDLNAGAACEVNIDHCYISGPAAEGNTCIGVWLTGSDSKIRNTTIAYCNPCIRLENQAHLILGNHLFAHKATAGAEHDVGIYIKGSDNGDVVITGNYIDNVSVFAESLNRVNLTNNYWLTQAEGSITPAWVIYKPLGSGYGIQCFICTGNTFKCGGGAIVESFRLDTTAGSLDVNGLFEVIIKDNAFYGTTFRTSHPKGAITFSGATSGNKDFTSVLPFGANVKSWEGSTLITSSGPGAAYALSSAGNVVSATTASAITGKVMVRVSINNDDTKP